MEKPDTMTGNDEAGRLAGLVKRLSGTPLYYGSGEESDLGEEAATALATLSARVEELEGALRPFAKDAAKYDDANWSDNTRVCSHPYSWDSQVTIADLRRARSALSTAPGGRGDEKDGRIQALEDGLHQALGVIVECGKLDGKRTMSDAELAVGMKATAKLLVDLSPVSPAPQRKG